MAWTERYVRADAAGGGDGTTDANSGANGAWTLDEAIAAVTGGTRVNVKAGTYAYTATKTFSVAGSETAPIWWRGFNATIGDLDAVNVNTNFPWLDFNGDFKLLVSAGYNWIQNLTITGAVTTAGGGVLHINGPESKVIHCHVTGEAADADSKAIIIGSSGDNAVIRDCYLTTTSSANVVGSSSNAVFTVIGCVINGGNDGVVVASTAFLFGNIFINQADDAIECTIGGGVILNNSIYSPGGDGIQIAATVSQISIINNVIVDCGGWGINIVTTGANPTVLNNSFDNNTSGNITNLYESNDYESEEEAATPYTNAGSGNFTLVSTAAAKQSAYPTQWLSLSSITGYGDRGAVQLVDAPSPARLPQFTVMQ